MGRPRLRGQHVKLQILGADGQPFQVGEISKCSVKELGELKKSRAIGEPGITSTKTFEGYDLSFEGGKVDWRLAQLMHLQDERIYTNSRSPYFQVSHIFTYYDNSTDTYIYPEVTIHGYNLDIDATDELTEKFEGFCGEKRTYTTSGSTATTQTSVDAIISGAIEFAKGLDTDIPL